jgi:hypothetical protein
MTETKDLDLWTHDAGVQLQDRNGRQVRLPWPDAVELAWQILQSAGKRGHLNERRDDPCG